MTSDKRKTKKKGRKPMDDDGVRDASNMVEETEDSTDYKARCAAMEADWAKLNEFLNKTAYQHHWCSEYEQRLTKYNSHFTTLQLLGRSADRVGREQDPYFRQMIRAQETEADRIHRAATETTQRRQARDAYLERQEREVAVRRREIEAMIVAPNPWIEANEEAARDPYTMVRVADDGPQFVRVQPNGVAWDQPSTECSCAMCRGRRERESQ